MNYFLNHFSNLAGETRATLNVQMVSGLFIHVRYLAHGVAASISVSEPQEHVNVTRQGDEAALQVTPLSQLSQDHPLYGKPVPTWEDVQVNLAALLSGLSLKAAVQRGLTWQPYHRKDTSRHAGESLISYQQQGMLSVITTKMDLGGGENVTWSVSRDTLEEYLHALTHGENYRDPHTSTRLTCTLGRVLLRREDFEDEHTLQLSADYPEVCRQAALGPRSTH